MDDTALKLFYTILQHAGEWVGGAGLVGVGGAGLAGVGGAGLVGVGGAHK